LVLAPTSIDLALAALACGLLGGLAGGLSGQLFGDWRARDRASGGLGVWSAGAGALGASIVWLLLMWGTAARYQVTLPDLPLLLYVGFGLAFIGGITRYSQTITAVERLRWSWAGWQTGMTGMFLGATLSAVPGGFLLGLLALTALALESTPTEPVVDRLVITLATGWIIALLAGAFCWIAGGLIGGLVGWLRGSLTSVRLSSRRAPNEGMWWSARSALMGMFVSGLSAGIVGALIGWGVGVVFNLPEGPASAALGAAATLGLGFAMLGGMRYGGRAVVQHALLRLALWRAGATPAPWRYVRFLDYAADRVLLRKVGGGYIFIHPLLMDYLAGLQA
jgi:hypothetical protein